MNRYDPKDHERAELYDKPKQMPDGSLYAIVRNQGRFSTKFQLADYPFDTQFLRWRWKTRSRARTRKPMCRGFGVTLGMAPR